MSSAGVKQTGERGEAYIESEGGPKQAAAGVPKTHVRVVGMNPQIQRGFHNVAYALFDYDVRKNVPDRS